MDKINDKNFNNEVEINENIINEKFSSTKEVSLYSDDKSHQNTTIDLGKNNYIETEETKYLARTPINIEKDRFPYCIVWTPLPLISWFIPCIGHTGICGSDGKIYDFAGSYYINVGDLAFGKPYKYIQLNPDLNEQEKWDESVFKANDRFLNEEHNICLNNCHSHVAHALNLLNYKNTSDYTMFHIWWMCMTQSKYVSNLHIVKSYLGFVVILLLIFFLIRI